MELAVFWVDALCTLVQFTDVSEMILAFVITHPPNDGGSSHL